MPKFLPVFFKLDDFPGSHLSLLSSIFDASINEKFRDLERTSRFYDYFIYFSDLQVLLVVKNCYPSNLPVLFRGVFRTFELRVLTVIDVPKIAGAKGSTVIDFPILRVLKHP